MLCLKILDCQGQMANYGKLADNLLMIQNWPRTSSKKITALKILVSPKLKKLREDLKKTLDIPHLLTSFESLAFLLILLDALISLLDLKGEVLDYIEKGAQRTSVSALESEVKGFLATEIG